MTPRPTTCPADLPVADFIDRFLLGGRHSAYPVRSRHGDLVGVITLDRVRDVLPGARGSTTVGEAAIPLDEVTTSGADEPLLEVLTRSTAIAGGRVLVIDDGVLEGIVSPSDISRVVDARAFVRARDRLGVSSGSQVTAVGRPWRSDLLPSERHPSI